MKAILVLLTTVILVAIDPYAGFAQVEQNQTDTTKQLVVVIKNDGTEYVGYIISQDEREVLLETESIGKVYIPKHEIKSIRNITEKDILGKEYLGDPVFGTRYFVTTNGFNGEKGDNYIIWNWWGPDIQFSVSNHVTIGVLTTWAGIPLIGSVKYGTAISDRVSVGAGILLGSSTWAAPEVGLGVGYGSLTIGTRANNFSFSAGYGAISTGGRDLFTNDNPNGFLASVGTHQQLAKKFSFVFDSFLGFSNGNVSGIIVPGFRMLTDPGKAIQFGFTGIITPDEGLWQGVIPVVGWMRTF